MSELGDRAMHIVEYDYTIPASGTGPESKGSSVRHCDTLAKVYRTLRGETLTYVRVTLDLDVQGCLIQTPTIEFAGTPEEVTEAIKRPFRGL